jgi:hypothetical protein
MPMPEPSWMTRSSRAKNGLQSRLNKTSLLDKYMRKLKGCCPSHFASGEGIQDEHYQCQVAQNIFDDDYQVFKRSFKFKKFTYCFHCALPQNSNHNNEEPSCHSGFKYTKGNACAFSGFIFKSVYYLWKSGVAAALASRLGLPKGWDSLAEFNLWVNKEENTDGKYINLLEIFIAFCTQLEDKDMHYFL